MNQRKQNKKKNKKNKMKKNRLITKEEEDEQVQSKICSIFTKRNRTERTSSNTIKAILNHGKR